MCPEGEAFLSERKADSGVLSVPTPGCTAGWPLPASDLPGGLGHKESACNAGGPGSIPESGRFPWRRKWQPTPVFLPGKSNGESDFTFFLSFLLRYFLILKTKKNSSIVIVIRILVTFVGRALYGLGRAKRDPSWVNRMFYKFI